MRRVLSWFLPALLVATTAAACTDNGDADDDAAPPASGLTVVASFFPLAEVARAVGGDDVTVVDLTPPGVEPHDVELTTRQRDQLEDADVVVLVGGGFQPAVDAVVAQIDAVVVDANEAGEADPHVWLDPIKMMEIAASVARALVAVDPERADAYEDRAEAYRGQLTTLHEDFQSGLAVCERRVIVTAHDAFDHLAGRYNLEPHAVAIEPDAEPNPNRIAELADLVRERGVTTIFTEELVSPRVAETLARETGVTTAVLDPVESQVGSSSYLDAMASNLVTLTEALGCTP